MYEHLLKHALNFSFYLFSSDCVLLVQWYLKDHNQILVLICDICRLPIKKYSFFNYINLVFNYINLDIQIFWMDLMPFNSCNYSKIFIDHCKLSNSESVLIVVQIMNCTPPGGIICFTISIELYHFYGGLQAMLVFESALF